MYSKPGIPFDGSGIKNRHSLGCCQHSPTKSERHSNFHKSVRVLGSQKSNFKSHLKNISASSISKRSYMDNKSLFRERFDPKDKYGATSSKSVDKFKRNTVRDDLTDSNFNS